MPTPTSAVSPELHATTGAERHAATIAADATCGTGNAMHVSPVLARAIARPASSR